MKRTRHLLVTFVLAAGAHGLALMLVCALPCLRAAEPGEGPIEVVSELEVRPSGSLVPERVAVSSEGPEAPAEERPGVSSDVIPEAPGIPVAEFPVLEPVSARPFSAERLAGWWAELPPETRSSTVRMDGGG